MVVFGRPVAGSVELGAEHDVRQGHRIAARSGAVTDPMKALSLYFRWLYTMSRWRLLTGRSTGSQIFPPE